MILIFTLSCDNKTKQKDLIQYKDGRQSLTVNKIDRFGKNIELPEIGVILSDSIIVGKELLAKVYMKDKRDFKMIDAYIDCIEVENPSVDTIPDPINKVKRLSGCRKGLITRNDTIYIGLTPQRTGKMTFGEITILTRDMDKIYRTQKYSFDYNVIEN